MAARAYPISQVTLYEARRQFVRKYDGFAHNELLADLYRRGELTISPLAGGQWPYLLRGAAVPGSMLVEAGGLNALIARPHLDTSQAIGLGHFRPLSGKWLAMPGLGLGAEVKLYQYDGAPNLPTGIESNFSLPANPIFAVSLYRAQTAPGHNWSDPPYTEIHWSVGGSAPPGAAQEWALAIPYGEPMLLLRYANGAWQKVADSDAGLDMPVFEGMARGRRVFLWFAVIRGHLVISTDGFVDHVWIYPLAGTGGLPADALVPGGKVSLWHNAGQWAFSFYPIAMCGCRIQSPPFAAGYDTRDCTGELLLNYRHLPVIDDEFNILQQVSVRDNTEEMSGLQPDRRTWEAELAPYLFSQDNVGTDPESGEPVSFHTAVSPQLYSVQIGQYAELHSGDEPAAEDLTARVISISGQHPPTASGIAARYGISLDNQDGALVGVPEYRQVAVALGWRLKDGQNDLAAVVRGYGTTPELDIAPGGQSQLHLELLDPMIRLRDEKADGRTPVFDGWSVRAVCEWVLDRCGLDRSEQDLEDTGVHLSPGRPEEPLWQAEPGRPWIDFLQQIAAFDHGAALFFDESGRFVKACPYCRQKRTEEDVAAHDGTTSGACDCTVAWELYTRPTAAPDPTAPGEILRLSRLRESLATADYRNYVMVAGTDARGRPVRSVAYDAASLYDPDSSRYVGWRKMEVYEIRGVTSQAEANRLAAEQLQYFAPEPEHIVLITPLEARLAVGQVLRVNGGEAAGVSGRKYRIWQVDHRVHKAPRQLAYSAIKAKALAEDT